MKKFILLLLLFPFFSFSQESYSKEFTISTDNDLFISYVNDRYYSSGLFFDYRYVSKDLTNEKKIKSWSLEHQIFTPFKSIVLEKSQHDRPFAALLYLSYKNLIVRNNYIRKSEIQLGMMGPAAIGKSFQTFIHNIYGFIEPIGWRYQIKNSFALNYGLNITKKLIKNDKKFSDSYYSYGFSAGTIHTHTNFSLGGRVGFKELAGLNESIAFGTHLSKSKKRKIESFVHWKITNRIILYDATLQGGLFEDKSPVTFTPNRVRFSFELGYLFTAKNWNFGYKAIYQTNERSDLVYNRGHFYGNIFISKLFN